MTNHEKKNVLRYITERIIYCQKVIMNIDTKADKELLLLWNSKINQLEDLYKHINNGIVQ